MSKKVIALVLVCVSLSSFVSLCNEAEAKTIKTPPVGRPTRTENGSSR